MTGVPTSSDARVSVDEMVFVEAGPFIVGADEYISEAPRRKGDIDAFWIDRYPVTNDDGMRYVRSTGAEPPVYWSTGTPRSGTGNHRIWVKCGQADDYARWAGKRFPTEAELEKAAHGTDDRRFPWCDTFDEVRTLTSETASVLGGVSEPVTARPDGESPYGCEQMAGLVEEWIADWYVGPLRDPYQSQSYGERFLCSKEGSWIFAQTHAGCSYRCYESVDLDVDLFASLGGSGLPLRAQRRTFRRVCGYPMSKTDGARREALAHDMVLVPGGPFHRGSDEFEPERPRHEVAACVSFDDAQEYVDWAGLRPPNETAWENAARGVDGRRWPWGDEFDDSCAFVWDVAPVVGFEFASATAFAEGAGQYGVSQLCAGIEEWVQDELRPQAGGPLPTEHSDDRFRVLRGGSWFFTIEYFRCAFRRGADPGYVGFAGSGGPGFRCARDATSGESP